MNSERKLQRIRKIRTSEWNYVYLDLELKFPNKSTNNMSEIGVREFKLIILSSIESLFGEFGYKMLFDILKYRPDDCRAYIRVSAKDYVKFRLSLTLCTQWNDVPCHFVCYKACHSMSSLSISPQCPIDAENILTENNLQIDSSIASLSSSS